MQPMQPERMTSWLTPEDDTVYVVYETELPDNDPDDECRFFLQDAMQFFWKGGGRVPAYYWSRIVISQTGKMTL
jgi:hypothetical protein